MKIFKAIEHVLATAMREGGHIGCSMEFMAAMYTAVNAADRLVRGIPCRCALLEPGVTCDACLERFEDLEDAVYAVQTFEVNL